MASIKPGKETSQDFAADLASLRDDVAKLNSIAVRIHSDTFRQEQQTLFSRRPMRRKRFLIQRTKRMILWQEQPRTLRPRLSTNPWWRRLSRWLPACSWDC